MQQRHRARALAAKGKQRELKARIEHLVGQLTVLEGLDQISPAVEAAEKERGGIVAEEERTRQLEAAIDRIQQLDLLRRTHGENCRILAELSSPPAMQETKPLEEMIVRVRSVIAAASRERGSCEALAAIAPPPPQENVAPLQNAVRELDRAQRDGLRASARAGCLKSLADPVKLDDPSALESLIKTWAAAAERVERHAAEIRKIERDLAEVEGQVRDWAAANPLCPVCGAQVDPHRLLSREHNHA